ncbi:hypothetical protein D3C87_2054390 [compost metagenome]
MLEFRNFPVVMGDAAVEPFEPYIVFSKFLDDSDAHLGIHSVRVELQRGHIGLR